MNLHYSNKHYNKSESKIQNNLTLHMESSLTFQGRLGHYANHSHKISKEKDEKKS
uniref:Uncharacterized protein n=1 Tax=Cannabis sativa TaxID=3483 RepID=A0A803R5T5_CANSA